jgi:hypothetical protein
MELTLWSVSVCDIIYKLQYLVDLYADSAAKEILDEITSLQDSDKKSPFDHTKIKQRTLEVSAGYEDKTSVKYTFVLPKCIFSAIFSNENSFNLNNPYNNLQLTPKITSDNNF